MANRRHCYLRQTRPRRAALLPLLRHSANRTLLEVAFEPGDVYNEEEVRPLLGGARLTRLVLASSSSRERSPSFGFLRRQLAELSWTVQADNVRDIQSYQSQSLGSMEFA